ncbi:MAG: hypothetical protein ACK4JC_02030 [Silanimonas lenta]
MASLRRWIWRLFLVFFALLLALAALWAYGRLSSPTAAQRAAVALMQALPAAEGENGFVLLRAQPPAPTPTLPAAARCAETEAAACLERMAALAPAEREALEAWRPALEAAARALRAPVFRDERETVELGDELPSFQRVMDIDSLRAFDFARGETASALAALCEDTRGALRWAAQPESLIQGMVGIAAFRQNGGLIAEMRRRAPADPLPPACAALAEAPDPAQEGLLCPALRGEWWYWQRLMPALEREAAGQAEGPWRFLPNGLLHDGEWAQAVRAETFAIACGEAAVAAARADQTIELAPGTVRWVDHMAYPASAWLLGLGEPFWRPYQERQLDFLALRRLLAAALQMAQGDPALGPEQRFAALPAGLREGPRPLRLETSPDGNAVLAVALRAPRSTAVEAEARLPVAGPLAAP